jgi:protein phosphatase
MSSTMAGVFFTKGELAVFNCGDCRVYRFSRPYLAKLSHDHSIVQSLFDSGAIGEEEMRSHPQKNVIISSVGIDNEQTEIFFKKIPIGHPLTLFLCSDGVWETLSLDRLEEILCQPAKEAATVLANELFEQKAKDNISFVILEI